MNEVYGYGYVTKLTKNISRSTIYKSLRGRFIWHENIYIDILESDNSRKELNFLLSEKATTNDTIVIMNKRTLGTTSEFRQWWYRIYEQGINLLIINDTEDNGVDYYSTTDFSFERYNEDAIQERWSKLQTAVFERQTKQIGRKTIELTEKFITTYWAYQSFFVTVDEAYQNLGVSKQTFYTMCKKYEQTTDYKEALLIHTELFEYPRRGGVDKELERLFIAVEQRGLSLEDACKELNIMPMLPEEYHRHLLAKQGGRKIQFQMEAKHHREDYFKKNN